MYQQVDCIKIIALCYLRGHTLKFLNHNINCVQELGDICLIKELSYSFFQLCSTINGEKISEKHKS